MPWLDESILKYELKLPLDSTQSTRSFIAFLTRLCDEADEKERLDSIEREENRKSRLSSRRVQKQKAKVVIDSDPEEIPDPDDEPEPPVTPDSAIEDRIKCDCGTIVKKSGMTRHKKSDKHKNHVLKNL